MLFLLDFDRTIFDTEKFYNALEKGLIIPSEALNLESIGMYMYEDTLPFLQRRTEMGDTLILVTRGELVIQKTKVENSGIASFFVENSTCRIRNRKMGRSAHILAGTGSQKKSISSMILFPSLRL